MIREVRTVAVVVCFAAISAVGDTVTCKDGRVFRGRVTSESKQTVMIEAPGGAAISTVPMSEVDHITRGDSDAGDLASKQNSPPDGPPNVLGLFNQLAAAGEQNARIVPTADATTVQREGVGETVRGADDALCKALVGKRVSVLGRVDDVTGSNGAARITVNKGPYRITVSFAADIPRLSKSDRARIDDYQERAKDALQRARDARTDSARKTYKQSADSYKSQIAEVHRQSKANVPRHCVCLLTKDTAATTFRKGWGISTEATITSVQVYRCMNGDTLQCYVRANATSEVLGKHVEAEKESAGNSDTE